MKEIAEEVNLSSPAVSARITKLENENYILGYQAVVNTQKIGLQIKGFISLEVLPEQKGTVYPFINPFKNVVECN